MIAPDPSNKLFKIATELVNHSSSNIFLTGKAGTGKTTFLRFIKEQCAKQSVVVAPTGVAAINAGGTTIHSFFQLPFSPFVPGTSNHNSQQKEVTNKNSLVSRMRVNNEKRKIFQQLDLLIIDEVGRLELEGAGFFPSVKEMLQLDEYRNGTKLLLLVVRDSLYEQVLSFFGITKHRLVNKVSDI